jgi:hypothetical protein
VWKTFPKILKVSRRKKFDETFAKGNTGKI